MKKNAKLGCCGRMLGKYLPAELKRYMSVFWPDLYPSFNESLVPFEKKKLTNKSTNNSEDQQPYLLLIIIIIIRNTF